MVPAFCSLQFQLHQGWHKTAQYSQRFSNCGACVLLCTQPVWSIWTGFTREYNQLAILFTQSSLPICLELRLFSIFFFLQLRIVSGVVTICSTDSFSTGHLCIIQPTAVDLTWGGQDLQIRSSNFLTKHRYFGDGGFCLLVFCFKNNQIRLLSNTLSNKSWKIRKNSNRRANMQKHILLPTV